MTNYATHKLDPPPLSSGADTGFMKGGGTVYERCRRQCTEARSADESARSAEKIFRLHFSLLRMGSRGTFALCTASFQMYEDCRSQGRHA